MPSLTEDAIVDTANPSYLDNGGRRAIITNPPNLARAIAGDTGTPIVRG